MSFHRPSRNNSMQSSSPPLGSPSAHREYCIGSPLRCLKWPSASRSVIPRKVCFPSCEASFARAAFSSAFLGEASLPPNLEQVALPVSKLASAPLDANFLVPIMVKVGKVDSRTSKKENNQWSEFFLGCFHDENSILGPILIFTSNELKEHQEVSEQSIYRGKNV